MPFEVSISSSGFPGLVWLIWCGVCPLDKAFFQLKYDCCGVFTGGPVWPRSNQSACAFDLPSPILRHHMLLWWFGGVWVAAKPRQANGIKLVIILICSASQYLNNGRTEKGAGDATCPALSWACHFALEHLPHTDFLWQMCQHLILLSFSFSYFTPGACYMARPDKNKFIRMQATESLEYIPVKGPWGQQRNHL